MSLRKNKSMVEPVLVVHGGAWDIPDNEIQAHEIGIIHAIETGWVLLERGESAVTAVETSIACMEDNPVFDAGRGSCLNTDGTIEMDASIMDGRTLRAGAVAALRNFPHPIKVARKVMEETEHVLLAGEGAAQFARQKGFSKVPIEELLTERELLRLKELKKDIQFKTPYAFGKKKGTVGAVALDGNGDIAAGTSTGGTPKKIPGRVGDSPIIGSGTYADNSVGGVSCTGWGESILIVNLAKKIIDLLEYGITVDEAAKKSIEYLTNKVNGLAGVIIVDKNGKIGIYFNTPKMARGYYYKNLEEPYVKVL